MNNMALPVDHDLELVGACVLENVPVSVHDLARLLLWVVSVDLDRKGWMK